VSNMSDFLQTPLVSVIIPLHNKERFLSATLDSVLAQDYEQIEVIIVNDGSTDSSLESIRDVDDVRLRIINQVNSGVESARNTGFQLSRGKFVTFLDADDLIHPSKIASQVSCFAKKPELVLLGTAAKLIDSNGICFGKITPPTDDLELRLELLFGNPFVCSSVMVRRVCLETDAPFEMNQGSGYAEDFALWKRLASSGSVGNLPELLTSYRKVNNSRSRNLASAPISSAREIAAKYLYENSNLFNSMDDAFTLVTSVNGINNLTLNPNDHDLDCLKLYNEVVDAFELNSTLLCNCIRAHTFSIKAWTLLGSFPLSLQARLYAFLFNVKNSKPIHLLCSFRMREHNSDYAR
jgi:glycosyltransferase involved in cell wall biosynthesis